MANDLQRRDGLFDNLMNMRNFFDDGFFHLQALTI